MYYDIKESGKRLSELRKMKGLTQQQVADELGMDVDTVRKNEQGRRGLSIDACLLYTSPSPRDRQKSRMPSSA